MSSRSALLACSFPIWVAVVVLSACAPAVEDASSDVFRIDVVPILEARCSAAVCHGMTPAGRAAGEVPLEGSYVYGVNSEGRISDWGAAREQSLRFVNALEGAEFSSLIRKPLPTVYGGLPHGGGDNLVSLDDPAMETLRRWIALEPAGGEDPSPSSLSDGEQFFANAVLPELVRRTCTTSSCHGPSAFNPYLLDPGVPGADGNPRFSVGMVRENYLASHRYLALDGNAQMSRLLRKALPLDRGGITHRGGNRTFLTGLDDGAALALFSWVEKETRSAGVASGWEDGGKVQGIVYVRGPVQPSSPFEVTTFNPGTDLHLRVPAGPGGEDRNITAHLHDGGADIRDPVVSFDGKRVAFSMRPTLGDGASLFELDLESAEVRRLSQAPRRLASGAVGADVMPAYGSDGAIYFISNRHDRLAERLDASDLSIYRVDLDGGEPERLTYGPGPELNPRLFHVGPMQGQLIFTHRRSVGLRDETVGFLIPLDLQADYHIYFGITPAADHFLVFEEMADGRALTIMGDPGNLWGGGQLALVDRILGPMLGPGQDIEDATVPAYASALRLLDPSAAIKGVSPGGVYRDPVGLPDGSILVARALGPIDNADPLAEPRFEIMHLTLREESLACVTSECMPRIRTIETWISAGDEDVSVHSPRPVFSRVTAGASPVALDPTDPTLFALADAAVNQALLENLFPHGVKVMRDDVRHIRLVEALPQSSERWRRTPRGQGTNLSLHDHLPMRILDEIELEADGSALVEVPPHTPFRIQLLDDRRMAVGEQHNRWLFNWKGQYFPESIDSHRYDMTCAGCHGTFSGNAEDVLRPSDVLTAATTILAEYQDRNPRLPRTAVKLNHEMRRPVAFDRDVQPILTGHCLGAGCHGVGPAPAGGLLLEETRGTRFTASYESLMAAGTGSGGGRSYVDAPNTSARTSYLMEIVMGEELDAPRSLIDHPPLAITEDERLTLVRWIETGAAFRDPSPAERTSDEGGE
ncbi:MAG: hypothetical protein ACNA8W_04950 [Bradymonadaceae bacterium]